MGCCGSMSPGWFPADRSGECRPRAGASGEPARGGHRLGYPYGQRAWLRQLDPVVTGEMEGAGLAGDRAAGWHPVPVHGSARLASRWLLTAGAATGTGLFVPSGPAWARSCQAGLGVYRCADCYRRGAVSGTAVP